MPVNHKSQEYKGFVYCLTTPTGAYITRRNGKVGISGNSANFFNKTDNGFTVYRDYETGEVMVYIQKVRNEFVGKIGQVSFRYDKFTGRYSETGDFISDSKFLERRLRDQLNLDL
jgi:hypothetical protein